MARSAVTATAYLRCAPARMRSVAASTCCPPAAGVSISTLLFQLRPAMTAPVGVVVADDHSMYRYGIQAVLAAAPKVEFVGEVASGGELLGLVEREDLDVVLTDSPPTWTVQPLHEHCCPAVPIFPWSS